MGSVCGLSGGGAESAVPCDDLPGARCPSDFQSGLHRGLPADLLEAPHIQLVVQALTSRCAVDGYRGRRGFPGWKPESLCADSTVACSQFAGGGRADVMIFRYTDVIHHLALCLPMVDRNFQSPEQCAL